MKRLLSFLLALSLAVGLLAGLTLTASAETVIERIDITGVTAPVAGNAPTTEGITVTPGEGVTYTAEWEVYDYEDGWFRTMEEGAQFASGNMYRLRMEIDLGENRGDHESIRYDSTLNGESLAPYGAWYDEEANIVYVDKEFSVGVTMIETIVVENLPAAEAGASTAASQIVLPEDANYSVTLVEWAEVDYEEGTYEHYEGETLEDGKRYEMTMYLKPAAGYWFARNPEVQANAAFNWVSAEGYYADLYFTYDLRPVVSKVAITGVPEPAFGEEISNADIKIPEDANYTLEASWMFWTDAEGWVEVDSGTFGYGEYLLYLDVIPAEGYSIAEDVSVTIDGTPFYGWDFAGDRIRLETTVRIEPEKGYIHDVEISGVPEELTVGADITAPTLTVEDGKTTITGTQWLDKEHEAVTGKFEDGKVYYLAITMKPSEAGYAFDNWLYVYVGDHSYQTQFNPDGTVVVYVRFSGLPTVDAVNVTVTVPEIGAVPAEPKVEGDKAVIVDYWWYEYNSGEEVTKFEDGKKYFLHIELGAAEGYDFGGNVKLTINGQEPDDWGHGDDTASIGHSFTFLDLIDRIDITMPEPAIGNTPSYADIKLGSENYTIEYAYWYSNTTGEEVTEAFGKDKYTLDMRLVTAEGWEFSKDCKIYINGVEVEDGWADDFDASVYASYSFRDVINKIELPAFPVVKVGDTVETELVEVPEGTNYQIIAQWLEYDSEDGMREVTGPIEDGKAYYLILAAAPNPGYEFAEDAAITVAGEVYQSALMSVDADYVGIIKLYSFGMKVIDKIELTTPAPENGKTHGQIKVPENAGYSVEESYWGVSKTDDLNDVEEFGKEDTFAYGNYYWIGAVLQAEEGYVFADDVKITVNGQAVELNMETSYIFGNEGQVTYCLGQLKVPAADENPKTGDTAPMAVMAALMLLSAAAVAVTVVSKKKYI